MASPEVLTLDELVELHVANLYRLDSAGRMAAVQDGRGSPPPRFALVRSAAGSRPLVAASLPTELAEALLARAAGEPAGDPPPPWPRHTAEYRRILEDHAPVAAEYCGPAFYLPEAPAAPAPSARLLTDSEQGLLAPHFPSWAGDFEESRPLAAVVDGGVAVSVCGCARRKSRATEAGVETAAGHRGRGHARAATRVWAEALRAESRLPLYSTSWENHASQRVASALGAVPYAVDFHLR